MLILKLLNLLIDSGNNPVPVNDALQTHWELAIANQEYRLAAYLDARNFGLTAYLIRDQLIIRKIDGGTLEDLNCDICLEELTSESVVDGYSQGCTCKTKLKGHINCVIRALLRVGRCRICKMR
jgi:hypothetical protein